MNFNTKVAVEGESVFRVYSESFYIAPPAGVIDLQCSGDGVNFITLQQNIAAGEGVLIRHAPAGLYYKLVGNTATLIVSF